MPAVIIVIGIIAWFIFGNPSRNVANAIWSDDAAPWEEVDAFYYPDRNNLAVFDTVSGLESVDDCRVAVSMMASNRDDPSILRGDYECAVGLQEGKYGFAVYRLTVR